MTLTPNPFIPYDDDSQETLRRILFDVVLALRNLSGGTVTLGLFDAKGDLLVGTADDTAAALGVGTNGQFLVVDLTTLTGLKWIDHGSTGDPHPQYITAAELAAALAALTIITDHGGLTGLADDDHPQYVRKATLTTKGDLYAATAPSTPARVPVGTNGQVLTANSGVAAGVGWATPAPIGRYRQFAYVVGGPGDLEFLTDEAGGPLFMLLDLE